MQMNHNHTLHATSQSRPLVCRGVRGATTVEENTEDAILEATRELLYTLIRVNDINPNDIASVYFTTTADLNASYPAFAARQLGWFDVALLCGHEMQVPGGLPRCIRVLIHWNTIRTPQEIGHIYLNEAKSLRADRKNIPPIRPIQVNMIEAAMRMLEQTL